MSFNCVTLYQNYQLGGGRFKQGRYANAKTIKIAEPEKKS
jgi:hypothetical protein